jgi:hypothetical protein
MRPHRRIAETVLFAALLASLALPAAATWARAPDVATPEMIATQAALEAATVPAIRRDITGRFVVAAERVHHGRGLAFLVVNVKRPNGRDIDITGMPLGRNEAYLEQKDGDDPTLRYQATLRRVEGQWRVTEIVPMATREAYLSAAECVQFRPILPAYYYQEKCRRAR